MFINGVLQFRPDNGQAIMNNHTFFCGKMECFICLIGKERIFLNFLPQ